MKPENILFTNNQCQDVKIIDFGSACTEYKNGFTYVQSRFYRAPEVVLGVPYNHAIDMWSFGCIIIEMVTGRPLFQVIDEKELLDVLRIRIGLPPQHMINRAKNRKHLFESKTGQIIRSAKSRIPAGLPDGCQSIRVELKKVGQDQDEDFIDFLERCLKIDPAERLTPAEALLHPWICRGWMTKAQKESFAANSTCHDDSDDEQVNVVNSTQSPNKKVLRVSLVQSMKTSSSNAGKLHKS